MTTSPLPVPQALAFRFFRGAGAWPFGAQIRSVRGLLERLLTPASPLEAVQPG